jgi:hypothetical protein
MKKILHISVIAIFFILAIYSLSFAQQESVTITTYYPSPYGSYKELRVQRMAIGESYYGSDYCWSPETCTNVIDTNADLVVEGNVGIGIPSPSAKLDVSGTLRFRDLINCTSLTTDAQGNLQCVGGPGSTGECPSEGWYYEIDKVCTGPFAIVCTPREYDGFDTHSCPCDARDFAVDCSTLLGIGYCDVNGCLSGSSYSYCSDNYHDGTGVDKHYRYARKYASGGSRIPFTCN